MTDRISQRVSSLFLLILTAFISNIADSATHFVDASASAGGDGSSWGTAFVSISEATGAAAAGDEILVKYGTYQEEGGLTINKDLKISSDDGTNATFIDAKPKSGLCILSGDGTTLGTNGMLIQGQVSNETIIQGLTISGYGAGIYMFGEVRPLLRHLFITQNLQNALKSAKAFFTIEKCLIFDNVYADRLFYLFFGTGEATVRNCTFVGNIGAYPVIQSFTAGDAVIENVLIWGNQKSDGTPSVGIDPDGQTYSVKNSIVEGGYADGSDIINSDPLFADASLGDFRLLKESPAIGAGIEGSDIGAFSLVPPPPLDHKVRKRLKERFFGGLPENPEMSDFDLQELKNVINLPLHHLGSEDEGLVLDSFNEYLPEAEELDLYEAHIENLEPLDGHPKLRVLHLKKAKFNRKDIFTKDDENGELVPISLPKLEELSLEETDFRDLWQLQHFTGLKRLRLNNNGLNSEKGDLTGLEDLIDLEYLDLRHNPRIRDIADLKKLAEAKIQAQISREHDEWGVDNNETEMNAAPSAKQSALNHEESHQPRPFWTVNVEGTSIPSNQVGELMEMGVRVFDSPQMNARINLLSGINMIGLPLDDRENWSARRLMNRLHRHIRWESSLPTGSTTDFAAAPAANQSALDHDRAYFMSQAIQLSLTNKALNLGWSAPVRIALEGSLGGLEGYGPNNVQCMYRIIPIGSWIKNIDETELQSLESTLDSATNIGSIKSALDNQGLVSVYDYILKVRAVWDEIPDDPNNGSYHSQTLDAQFVPGADGPQLIRYRDVSWVIHHDPVTQSFNTFIPEFDHESDGFPVRGGEGYIVQVGSNRQVSFDGQAWVGHLGSKPSSTSSNVIEYQMTETDDEDISDAPSLMVEHNVWAFMVVGELNKQMTTEGDVYQLRATNLTSGKQLASVQHQGDTFRLPLVDLSRQDVVSEGDLVKIEVINSRGKRIGESQFTVGQQEIATAYRLVRIQYNPIPEFSRVLQNYPNPFNPETWIPFELNQDAKVSVSIYDVSGKLVRALDVGFRPAGIYSSQEKAVYWDGKTETGETVASGVYFYNIQIGDYSETRRMVILK